MGWRLALLAEWLFRNVAVPALRLAGPLFFDRKYLAGRHFSDSGDGWRWVARSILTQRILRYNRHVPWPVSPFIIVGNARNITFDVDDLNNFQTIGNYFQSYAGRITLGRGSYIAPNTGFITANHDPLDPSVHRPGADIVLGECCWVGMNATIMPGTGTGTAHCRRGRCSCDEVVPGRLRRSCGRAGAPNSLAQLSGRWKDLRAHRVSDSLAASSSCGMTAIA